MLLVTAALVMAAMMLVMAMPALAFHIPGHTGGASVHCDTNGSCSGGSGGLFPAGCDTITGECDTDPQGRGGHSTFDPATGDETHAGGYGGQDSDEEITGGGGYRCETNGATGEQSCTGGSGGRDFFEPAA